MKVFSESEKSSALLRSRLAVCIYKAVKDARFIEDELATYDFDDNTLQAVEESLHTVCASLKAAVSSLLKEVGTLQDKKELKVLEDVK